MRTSTSAALGLIAAITLAGCSADPQEQASRSAEAVRSAAVAKTTDATGAFGARSELTKEKCASDDAGAWSFSGTLTNSQKADQGYVVTASVVDGKTFTVLGRKELKQTLGAGRSTELRADKFATSTRKDVQCVLRVTRKAA